MIGRNFSCVPGIAVAALVSSLALGAANKKDTSSTARGKEVYLANCAVCHGAEGRGDGPAAYLVFPKPRDFTRGIFKLRSTATIPTDADLLKTITQGIPGTAMPAWPNLAPANRQALVDYVKRFSAAFSKPAARVKIPRAPRFTAKMVAEGKQLYVDAGCDSCHGAAGRGDGASAPDLRDEWGYPIRPRDLTDQDLFKSGATPGDIYKVLQVGIGGTPMPVFKDTLTPEQSWQIVAYVQSLGRATLKTAAANRSSVITAKQVQTSIDRANPFDSLWERVTPTEIKLMTLWERQKTIRSVRVRALYTQTDLALCLEWDDPTADLTGARPQNFADGAAVEFPLGPKVPSFIMGEKGAGVNVWYWRADNGLPAIADAFAKAYPNAAIEDYPLESDPAYTTARAAGNRVYSVGAQSSLSEMNAEGFGTLTPQPSEDQQIQGSAVWREGRWRVVMVRPLKTTSSQDRQFGPGEIIPVAFAVWDGSQRDRNGQKAVSIWQELRLQRSGR
ncbi:MAG: ethylbenzene dehydrogenase-related protein [Alphaproteobacteria bacterium]